MDKNLTGIITSQSKSKKIWTISVLNFKSD